MRKARVIFAKYLDAGSDMDVKIDSETRSDIEKAISECSSQILSVIAFQFKILKKNLKNF